MATATLSSNQDIDCDNKHSDGIVAILKCQANELL